MFNAELSITLTSVCCTQMQGISAMELGETITERPGVMVLCIAQKGEDLWDISKRCRVRQQDLLLCNPTLNAAQVEPGSKIVALRMQ